MEHPPWKREEQNHVWSLPAHRPRCPGTCRPREPSAAEQAVWVLAIGLIERYLDAAPEPCARVDRTKGWPKRCDCLRCGVDLVERYAYRLHGGYADLPPCRLRRPAKLGWRAQASMNEIARRYGFPAPLPRAEAAHL